MAKRFKLRGGEANRAADAATVSDAATAQLRQLLILVLVLQLLFG